MCNRNLPSPEIRTARQLLILLVVALSFVTAACEQSDTSTLERVRQNGFIRAGFSEEKPYAFSDSLGRIRGESPEALRAVAEQLEIDDIRWVRLDFNDLIDALTAGRIDVIATGMYRTPARAEVVRFSIPTVCTDAALVVHQDSPIRSITDFATNRELTLAVLAGSVEEEAALELGLERIQLLAVPDLVTGLAALERGRADAVALTAPSARMALDPAGTERFAIRTYTPPALLTMQLTGCSALAFRPSDELIASAADQALRNYIGSRQHRDSLRALGFSEEDLPPVHVVP